MINNGRLFRRVGNLSARLANSRIELSGLEGPGRYGRVCPGHPWLSFLSQDVEAGTGRGRDRSKKAGPGPSGSARLEPMRSGGPEVRVSAIENEARNRR
jgi:hypothetical protein